MTIQIYILSKLIERDHYPYELKKGLSEPVPFDKMANITESKLYYHFESLTKQGLIEEAELIKEEHRPDKQLYTITEKGRLALPQKIYDVFEKSKQMSDLIIGLIFIQYVDIQKVITLVQVKKMALENKRATLTKAYEKTVIPAHLEETIHLANGYFMESLQREISWFERVLEMLHHD